MSLCGGRGLPRRSALVLRSAALSGRACSRATPRWRTRKRAHIRSSSATATGSLSSCALRSDLRIAIPIALGTGPMPVLRYLTLNALGAVLWAVDFRSRRLRLSALPSSPRCAIRARDVEIALAVAVAGLAGSASCVPCPRRSRTRGHRIGPAADDSRIRSNGLAAMSTDVYGSRRVRLPPSILAETLPFPPPASLDLASSPSSHWPFPASSPTARSVLPSVMIKAVKPVRKLSLHQ